MRRIRKLEADLRKAERNRDAAAKQLTLWNKDGLTYERALDIGNFAQVSASFPLADYPRVLPASQYEGPMSLWSALNDHIVTHEQARALAVGAHDRFKARAERWVTHLTLRLSYERAMRDEQGSR